MIVEKLLDYGRSFYSLLGERRKTERVEFACSITVSCKNRYGQLTTHACTCLNVSAKGMGFVSPESIAANSDVYIHSETHNLKRFAHVSYCSQKGDRNYVGCYFRPAPEYWN
jgi:c-di-GMP-binding flagellar brake protein YcgR